MMFKLCSICALAMAVSSAYGDPAAIFVDVDAPSGGDGSTWDTAYNTLQDALLAASTPRAAITEIRVAEGAYQPDLGGNEMPGDREAAFRLIEGVTIRGGFAGFGEADPDARDVNLYQTVLSGDLAGDDGPDFANNGENSQHVVEAEYLTFIAVLDGFTVIAGNADGSYPFSFGGGVFCLSSSVVFIDCTITGNHGHNGGGMASLGTFSWLYNCRFIGNVADGSGGGGEFQNSCPVLVNCLFAGNHADSGGGLRFLNNCFPEVVNCVFTANAADSDGGAIQVGGPSMESRARIANCILWTNTAGEGTDEYEQIGLGTGGDASVDYCCIEDYTGAIGGVGNIGDDPAFIDADGADDVPGTIDDNLRLTPGSPCSDAGNNVALPKDEADLDGDNLLNERIPIDADGSPRFADDAASEDSGCGVSTVVDMGPYEVAGDAIDILYGDVDGNGLVDIDDLFGVLAQWGQCTDCRPADVNGSGTVDIDDVFAVLSSWS